MARRAHRSSILSSSRTPDQPRVARSEHLVHFSRRRCFEHNQRPEHLTCRRPRLDVARRAHPWPGTWCTYRRSQYERYSLAVTSDGKVGPSGVVLRGPHGSKSDNMQTRAHLPEITLDILLHTPRRPPMPHSAPSAIHRTRVNSFSEARGTNAPVAQVVKREWYQRSCEGWR